MIAPRKARRTDFQAVALCRDAAMPGREKFYPQISRMFLFGLVFQ
jgi:hypothetical protein